MRLKTVCIVDVCVVFVINSINNEKSTIPYWVSNQATCDEKRKLGNGGIRTHASEETVALNQRFRPLGRATRYGRPSNSNQAQLIKTKQKYITKYWKKNVVWSTKHRSAAIHGL